MATYGKKKRLILPSFNMLRDSDPGSKGAHGPKPRDSIALTTSSSHHGPGGEQIHDSIAEMASELLDDTIVDKGLSGAWTVPNIATQGNKDKLIPQLPQLLFNGDDAWALRTEPVVTAASHMNLVSFDDDIQSSAPTIPRKSSKRKSTHQNRAKLPKNSISSPTEVLQLPPQRCAPVDAKNKVQEMLAATKALKGNYQESEGSKSMKSRHDRILQGPYLPSKKSLMESKVFTKMKSAFNDRLQVRSGRRRRDSVNERLLGLEWKEEHETILSNNEMKLNEDNNLVKPKVYSLAGQNTIARKPIQTSPSLHVDLDTHPAGATVQDDSDIDKMSLVDASESELPSETPRKRVSRLRKHGYDGDIDAILSSSPQAQSTPRLRLEPSFQNNGRTTLKNVPASSRSVFDFHLAPDYVTMNKSSEMDIDTDRAGTTATDDSLKRKTTVGTTANGVKRCKKHPSPTRDDLAGLASKVQYLPLDEQSSTTAPARDILSAKNANAKIRSTKRGSMHGKIVIAKQDLPKTFESITSIGGRGLKSAIRKAAHPQGFAEHSPANENEMDIDELQWDGTEYNIGSRKV